MTEVEFPRPLAVERIGAGVSEHVVAATPAECAALALRVGVPELHSLECRFRLHRGERGRIAAAGHLRARLVRECVVSLDLFETEMAEDFTVAFVPEGQESDDQDPESEDEVPYSGGAIDLGEAAEAPAEEIPELPQEAPVEAPAEAPTAEAVEEQPGA